MGHDSAFVSVLSVNWVCGGERWVLQIDKSAHAAKIWVAVMLRAWKTAVQALIAEISPWMLK